MNIFPDPGEVFHVKWWMLVSLVISWITVYCIMMKVREGVVTLSSGVCQQRTLWKTTCCPTAIFTLSFRKFDVEKNKSKHC